jgi:hypothetical protein
MTVSNVANPNKQSSFLPDLINFAFLSTAFELRERQNIIIKKEQKDCLDEMTTVVDTFIELRDAELAKQELDDTYVPDIESMRASYIAEIQEIERIHDGRIAEARVYYHNEIARIYEEMMELLTGM